MYLYKYTALIHWSFYIGSLPEDSLFLNSNNVQDNLSSQQEISTAIFCCLLRFTRISKILKWEPVPHFWCYIGLIHSGGDIRSHQCITSEFTCPIKHSSLESCQSRFQLHCFNLVPLYIHFRAVCSSLAKERCLDQQPCNCNANESPLDFLK